MNIITLKKILIVVIIVIYPHLQRILLNKGLGILIWFKIAACRVMLGHEVIVNVIIAAYIHIIQALV